MSTGGLWKSNFPKSPLIEAWIQPTYCNRANVDKKKVEYGYYYNFTAVIGGVQPIPWDSKDKEIFAMLDDIILMRCTWRKVSMAKGVFIWRRASPLGRASPPWRDLAIHCPRSRLGGLEIFHINALKRAGPPKRASKSKLRTHDKGCFDQHFSDNFSFHKLC